MSDNYTSWLTPGQIKNLFHEFNIRPRKTWGQSFLVDSMVVGKILSSLELQSSDTVVEIGPGLGAVTLELAKRARQIVAYEIDSKLVRVLETRADEQGLGERIRIRNTNFLTTEPVANLGGLRRAPYKVFSSLPYSQTSPILHKLICEHGHEWERGVFLMQKEVVEKILQPPPQASYWFQFINMFYYISVPLKSITSAAFWPQPKVKSSLIKLERKITPPEIAPRRWSQFLHRVFQSPRKQIRQVFDSKILQALDISPTLRPGELTSEKIVSLAKKTFDRD